MLLILGDIAFRFMDYSPLGEREVTVCDVSKDMLRIGKRKAVQRQDSSKGKIINSLQQIIFL